MSLSLATNERNDIFLGPTGSIALVDGPFAVAVAAQANAEARLGEMLYAADEGIPFFEVAFKGATGLQQFEAFVRQAIEQTDNVVEITSFEASRVDGVLTYKASILTTFGEALLNG